MLKSIVLENFKAFGNRTVVPLAPITLIYGQNSAGKSTILQSLNLLKQSRENRDSQALLLPRTDGGLVDLGSFTELLFNHDSDRTLTIGLTFAGKNVAASSRTTIDQILASIDKGIQLSFVRNRGTAELSLSSLGL